MAEKAFSPEDYLNYFKQCEALNDQVKDFAAQGAAFGIVLKDFRPQMDSVFLHLQELAKKWHAAPTLDPDNWESARENAARVQALQLELKTCAGLLKALEQGMARAISLAQKVRG